MIRHMRYIFATIVFLTMGISTAIAKSQPKPVLIWEFEPIGEVTADSSFRMRLIVKSGEWPEFNYGAEFRFEVVEQQGLVVEGPLSWTLPAMLGVPCTTFVDVTLSSQIDTCKLFLLAKCGYAGDLLRRYFVLTPDSVEVWPGRPAKKSWAERGPKRHATHSRQVLWDSMRSTGMDSSFSTFIVDSNARSGAVGSDSALPPLISELEDKPLTDEPFERIVTGSGVWMRWRGESEFVKNPTQEYLAAKRKSIRDSLTLLPDEDSVMVVLQLVDPLEVDQVEKVIGEELPAPLGPLFYRFWTTNGVVHQMRKMGLHPTYFESDPTRHKNEMNGVGDSVSSTPQGVVPSNRGDNESRSEQIYREDWEGSWYYDWINEDWNDADRSMGSL